MAEYEVFNGDADGILSLKIASLRDPRPNAKLVTGLKRDINLLKKIPDGKHDLRVFDISAEKNLDDIERLLNCGSSILYFDHHRAGHLPEHPSLRTAIDFSPKVCTACLVHRWADNLGADWAAAAAYGDNLPDLAGELTGNRSDSERQTLKRLGEAMNYNGYGESLDDLLIHPDDLSAEVDKYTDPFQMANESDVMQRLFEQKKRDEEEMNSAEALQNSAAGKVFLLPKSAASRRMSGGFGNRIARDEPALAHAVLTSLADGSGYRVSIRAPLENPTRADKLASSFPDGGGRARAAGINRLKEDDLDLFLIRFKEIFSEVTP